ncbi:sugar phosphate nucleotidyltransferase [Oleispirillum naphthae]|uniref:phosphocholine cytidylyltransferase family protein n=1 Tax=Oleispirillum naphthae TaxID=2838853 RepID=UPI0030826361
MIEKALILSAGQGKRLLPLTERKAKCLLAFNGRTLLEWQIACLAEQGIREITVVTGFRAEAIDAMLHARTVDGVRVDTLFNPFFQVADNLGSCFIAREMMRSGGFVLLNGDTLFHPQVFARARAQARGPITLTVDRKDRYDDDDMKVQCDGGRLRAVGKHLSETATNGESIGMTFFSAEGGAMFAAAVEAALHDPEGLKLWYLSVIDRLAREHEVRIASIRGLEWCEVDYPKDLAAAGALTARLWHERTPRQDGAIPLEQTGRAM